jgi:hypothetical protein
MMRVVDGRFVHHKMSMHRRPTSRLCDVGGMQDSGGFAAFPPYVEEEILMRAQFRKQEN